MRIGEDVWVGEKASILRGADVGAGSVIGSRTLVNDRIPPFSIVVRTPGRVIKSRLPKGMTAEEALACNTAVSPSPATRSTADRLKRLPVSCVLAVGLLQSANDVRVERH